MQRHSWATESLSLAKACLSLRRCSQAHLFSRGVTKIVTNLFKEFAMTKFSLSVLLAVSLLALSTAGASAQSSSGNPAASAATSASPRVPADANPNVPGATGDDIVRGDHSTIAGDRAETRTEQTGSVSAN
jgi:hypothetical protein